LSEDQTIAVPVLEAWDLRPSNPLSPNKSLLRSGGRWYLVCNSLAVIDKVPVISLGEPPAAELSRYVPV
jgi:hypothetical protein